MNKASVLSGMLQGRRACQKLNRRETRWTHERGVGVVEGSICLPFDEQRLISV